MSPEMRAGRNPGDTRPPPPRFGSSRPSLLFVRPRQKRSTRIPRRNYCQCPFREGGGTMKPGENNTKCHYFVSHLVSGGGGVKR